MSNPSVSIVICTDGRPNALQRTLSCLQYLNGACFEVCVVRGPTCDDTDTVLRSWSGRIKVGYNSKRNLSVSRNIGINLTSGALIAFIDDDGMPEPEWLEQIIRPFSDPQVGGVGGLVMDYTGSKPQYLYASANRLGVADCLRTTSAEMYNFPESFNFPYVQGTNSIFRRAALEDVGGFDEEYEFYLDETDVCCRLIDRGWIIRQLPDAVVHHKFLPSAIRTQDRITRMLFSVLKNKLYFSLINNRGHYPVMTAIESMVQFARQQENALKYHIAAGRLPDTDLENFQKDLDRAWITGLQRGLSGVRRSISASSQGEKMWLSFPKLRTTIDADRKCFVFYMPDYPMACNSAPLERHPSQRLANSGHQVHIITVGRGHNRVDFEHGVWVHRVVEEIVSLGPRWYEGLSARIELESITRKRHVTTVYYPHDS